MGDEYTPLTRYSPAATTPRCRIKDCFFSLDFCLLSVLFGLLIILVWFRHLDSPAFSFQVDSLTISNLNLSNSLITANWDLHYTARNPNNNTIYYKQITAAIYYHLLHVAFTTAPPFHVDKGNETTQKAGFAAYDEYVEKWAYDGMNREIARNGSIGFMLRTDAVVSFEDSDVRGMGCKMRVFCRNLFVRVALNKSSGNLLGGPMQCMVI